MLDHVTFPDDTREDFAYYPTGDPSEGKLESITVVGVDNATSRTWTYHWTGDDLTRIDRPDGTAVLYTYGDARFPGYLTRITLEGTDGTSTRVERAYEYDSDHNVVASWAGDVSKTGPDAVDLWQLAFDDPANPTVTTVTDPLDQEITYHLEHEATSESIKVTSIAGDCPVCGLGPNVTLAYDDPSHPLLPTATTDARGVHDRDELRRPRPAHQPHRGRRRAGDAHHHLVLRPHLPGSRHLHGGALGRPAAARCARPSGSGTPPATRPPGGSPASRRAAPSPPSTTR